MPRPPRIQTPGLYHVTMRGNNRGPIYRTDDDRRLFLVLLRKVASALGWQIHLWCLMTNHVHLLIEIKKENLAQGMQRLNGVYARAINDVHQRTGHVFERRYFSKPIENETQLENAAVYIWNNPVAAELSAEARQWPWTGGPLTQSLLDM